MSAWIGKRDALVEFVKYRSSLSVSRSQRSDLKTTIGGRVREFRAPGSRRSWDVGVDFATAAESAGFKSLMLGSEPPWVWVDPYAQVTNLLSPEQSVLAAGSWSGAGVSVGGSAVASDGVFAVRTLLHASGGTVDFAYRDGVPDRPVVLPGVVVSFSAYVRGAGSLHASFRDWAGQIIAETSAAYSNAVFSRASLVASPPAGAVSVRLWVTGALQVGLPAFTWTARPVEWSPGGGCNRVTVDGFDESVGSAGGGADGDSRFGSVSFVVRELG